jgi:sec-independent protein translocase protein TatB
MFEVGWSELLVIGVVALIAIGPKELPGVLRMVGQWMGKIRRMAAEFQGQFQEAMREAEMSDLKKQVDDMTNAAQSVTNFDPLESVRQDVEKHVEGVHDDLTGALDHQPTETAPATATATETATTAAPTPAATVAPAPEAATVSTSEPANAAGERP